MMVYDGFMFGRESPGYPYGSVRIHTDPYSSVRIRAILLLLGEGGGTLVTLVEESLIRRALLLLSGKPKSHPCRKSPWVDVKPYMVMKPS